MIEKTKRNLRIYIVLSMASVLILIFGGILFLSYFSTERSINQGLHKILYEGINGTPYMNNTDFGSIDNMHPPPNKKKFLFDNPSNLNKQPFFYFEVDDTGIINFHSFDFTDAVNSYEILLPYFSDIILEEKGRIKIDNSYYAFDSMEGDGTTAYALLDITMSHYTFTNLLYIGGIILTLSLIYISFISYKLTNKTLSPLILSIENQKRFSSDASHELRTPLASIRSNLDILTSYGDQLTEEEKTIWLENISNEIDRMTKLTSDLLLVSRDNPENQEDYTRFLANDLISSLEFFYNEKVLPKNTKVTFSCDDTSFLGVENEFKQLIIIFIDNGLKYNDKVSKEIQVSILNKDRTNQIVIRDNGNGIKEENHQQIFERFYRNDKARSNNQGFGLGLSIAKKIIDKYKGTIKVKSTIGEYTEFKINIPK